MANKKTNDSNKIKINTNTINTKTIALLGLLSAVTFLGTYISFPLYGLQGGLIHLGTLASALIAIIFGKKIGMISGSVGMTLFDLFAGPIWAPGTFVIRLISGYLMGLIGYKNNTNWRFQLAALLIGNLVIIAGYFLYGYIIFNDWATPLSTIWGDIITAIFSTILALILLPALLRLKLPNIVK